jgi:hypothetical protein
MSGLSLEGLVPASPNEAAALLLAPKPAASQTAAMSSRIKPSLLAEKVDLQIYFVSIVMT